MRLGRVLDSWVNIDKHLSRRVAKVVREKTRRRNEGPGTKPGTILVIRDIHAQEGELARDSEVRW